MTEVLESIEALKARFLKGGDEEDRHKIAAWETQYRKAVLSSELLENDAVKLLLQRCERRKAACERILREDRTLTERERDKVFERIDQCEWLKSFFVTAVATKKGIERKVRENS